MKKKGLLIAIVFLIVLPLAFGITFLSISRAETDKMHPAASGKLVSGVFAIKDDYANLFLIPCGEHWITVDAGISAKAVQRSLAELAIDPQNVTAVFLTHSDSDHTGAVSLFSKATVYLSRAEEQMINGQTKRFLISANHLDVPYKTLADGESVPLPGCSVSGILTPGHTPGSMVYRINDTLLFGGDTFSLKGGKVAPSSVFFNMDTPRQMQSLEALKKLDGLTYVFSGHYGYAPADALR